MATTDTIRLDHDQGAQAATVLLLEVAQAVEQMCDRLKRYCIDRGTAPPVEHLALETMSHAIEDLVGGLEMLKGART